MQLVPAVNERPHIMAQPMMPSELLGTPIGPLERRRSRLGCARPDCFISMLHAGKLGMRATATLRRRMPWLCHDSGADGMSVAIGRPSSGGNVHMYSKYFSWVRAQADPSTSGTRSSVRSYPLVSIPPMFPSDFHGTTTQSSQRITTGRPPRSRMLLEVMR